MGCGWRQNITPDILLEALKAMQEEGQIALTGDSRQPVIRKLTT